jgi:hypothetical protein
MASMQNIARLHRATEQIPKLSGFQQPDHERVKSDKLSDSRPAVSAPPVPEPRPVLRKFHVGRAESETYQLTGPEISAIMQSASALDRTGDFAALAQRDLLKQFVQARLSRLPSRPSKSAAGPVAIQI